MLGQAPLAQTLARPRLARPQDILALQRAVGNRAVSNLLSATRPAAGPRVQRAFTPGDADWNTVQDADLFTGGAMNLGVFKLTDNAGNVLVAKFPQALRLSDAFADVIISAGGLNSPGTAALSMASAGNAVLAAVRRVAARYATGSPEQQQLGQRLTRAADNAANAPGVLIMNLAQGFDVEKIVASQGKDKTPGLAAAVAKAKAIVPPGLTPVTLFQNPVFQNQLGRLYVADTILGNADRLSVSPAPNGEHFVQWNTGNFKATAAGIIFTLDNETQIHGRRVMAKYTANVKSPGAWVNYLLRGGEAPGQLHVSGSYVQHLEAIFDRADRELLFNEMIEDTKKRTKPEEWANFTLTFDQFDVNFLAGVQYALQHILQEAANIKRSAKQAAAGSENLDYQALKAKLHYLSARFGGATKEAAEKGVLGYAEYRALKEAPVARVTASPYMTAYGDLEFPPEAKAGFIRKRFQSVRRRKQEALDAYWPRLHLFCTDAGRARDDLKGVRAAGEAILETAEHVVEEAAHPDADLNAIKALQAREQLALERVQALDLALPQVIDNGEGYSDLAFKQAKDIRKYLQNGLIRDSLPTLDEAAQQLPDLADDPLPEWIPRANRATRKLKLVLFHPPGGPGGAHGGH